MSPTGVAIDLSVVIVSWNVRELLAACLRSIEAGPVTIITPGTPGVSGAACSNEGLAVEVIVVDAHSQDGSLEMLAESFPWVQVIAVGENVGFSRGNNIGMAAAQGTYILVLNPDTEIIGDALPHMVDHLAQHETVGIAGPQLLESDRVTVQPSRRRFPTLGIAFFESTWLQPLAPRSMLRRYYAQDMLDDQIANVDWVTGAALLTRRAVIDTVGGLDEAYFMYSEELDWCHRVKDAGWLVHYLPAAKVVHHGGKSSEQVEAQRHIYFQQSKVRYFTTYHSALSASLLRLFLLTLYCQQLLLEALKGLLGHKRDLRRERVRAYWRVLRSGLRS